MDLQEISRISIAALPKAIGKLSPCCTKPTTGELIHTIFPSAKNFLDPGDVLVLNDTRVFPARLHGVKETGKGQG